jgi:hypothetical protein
MRLRGCCSEQIFSKTVIGESSQDDAADDLKMAAEELEDTMNRMNLIGNNQHGASTTQGPLGWNTCLSRTRPF